ncbi:MAG: hypothetical protein ACPGXY_06805 [Alphaproteobacteria bacterium]
MRFRLTLIAAVMLCSGALMAFTYNTNLPEKAQTALAPEVAADREALEQQVLDQAADSNVSDIIESQKEFQPPQPIYLDGQPQTDWPK